MVHQMVIRQPLIDPSYPRDRGCFFYLVFFYREYDRYFRQAAMGICCRKMAANARGENFAARPESALNQAFGVLLVQEWLLAAASIQPEERERIGRFVFSSDARMAMVCVL